jgi:hypothetical protein
LRRTDFEIVYIESDCQQLATSFAMNRFVQPFTRPSPSPASTSKIIIGFIQRPSPH